MLATLNYVDALRSASVVELGTLALLALASAYSWALIALKSTQLNRARSQSVGFLETFWKASKLDAMYQWAQKVEASPLSKVFKAGYEELTKLAQHKRTDEGAMAERLGGIENVERALHRASTAELTELESRVPFLGTIGATAPF